MNTVSGLALTAAANSGCCWKYAIPTKPEPTAPIKHRTIQVIPMRRAAGIDLTESAAIKRTRI